jgi:hypothetical protein
MAGLATECFFVDKENFFVQSYKYCNCTQSNDAKFQRAGVPSSATWVWDVTLSSKACRLRSHDIGIAALGCCRGAVALRGPGGRRSVRPIDDKAADDAM